MVTTDAVPTGTFAAVRVWLAHLRSEKCEAVVGRIGAGDRTAFGDFYDLTAAKVLGIVRTQIADEALAEAATAEIFLEFWKSAPSRASTFEPIRSIVLFTVLWVRDRQDASSVELGEIKTKPAA